MDNSIWIVGYEDGKFWCANRSPYPSTTYARAMESALGEATLLMMKHHIKRDMSRARIVSDPHIGFGIPRLDAPEYIDYSTVRNTPDKVWVIEAPTRYQALKIARQDRSNLISIRRCAMQQEG